MDVKIPDKLTFKRAEVIKITSLDGRVIDYWEREFGGIKPVVNKLGEKFYTKQDIELILRIKQLMIVEKIEKSRIKKIIGEGENNKTETPVNTDNKRVEGKKVDHEKLKIIKSGLEEILTLLNKNGK
jgi:DNA-binding transcriptional MerR regulator